MPSSTVKRQSAAVMFTDIAGYTSIMASDEEKALSLLQDKRKILKPLIKQHNGVYVKGTGDGTLSYFDSAYNASKCAKLFQESIYDNKNMNVRVGIHVGDIVLDDGDVYGDGVNVASRLESMSPVGGICVSNTVYDELRNKKEFDGVELGLQSLKGVGRLIEIYGLKGDFLTEPKPSDYQDNKVVVHSDDEIPSIAIIPFRNKGKEEDAFYAYGICHDLIKDCSGAGIIRVASLERIEELDDLSVEKKAKKLEVRYIATGTLWKMDDIFQLSIELYDSKKSEVIWSDNWQENWDDLPTIKGSLSNGLLKVVDIKPKVEKQFETTNTQAYEYFLKGMYKWQKQINEEDLEIARGFLQKAIELDDDLIGAKDILAYTHPDFEIGLKMFESNINHAIKLDNKILLANSYFGNGWLLWKYTRSELAMDSFNNAIKIYNKLDNKQQIASSLAGLGMVYTFLGQYEKALETYITAQNILEEIDDKYEKCETYIHTAVFFYYDKKYNEVIDELNKIDDYFEKNGYQLPTAISYHLKGCLDFVDNNYQKAIINYQKSCDILETLGDNNNFIWTFVKFVLTQVIIGKVDHKENLQLIHDKIDDGWLNDIDYPEVNYILYKIYKKLNDLNKAKLYLKLAYDKIIQLSETIKKEEYKHSYLKGRNGEIVEAWKENN